MRLRRYEQIYTYENYHWWYKGRRILLSNILDNITKNKKIKILDFGCGPGSTINVLKKFGTTYGIDIEPRAIKYCREKGIKNVLLVKQNKKLPFKNATFDLIACLDVLEHIKNDSSTLNEFSRILNNNGVVIITVPSFHFLWGELDIRSHHVRRYNRKELINKLENSGFKIQKIFYFNYLFFVLIAIIRLFQKTKLGNRTSWGVDPVIQNYFINNLLTLLFSFDVKTAMRITIPFGVSLFVVARKK